MQRLANHLAGLKGRVRLLALFLCGAAATFALAPFGLFPVMFVAMPCLVFLFDGAMYGQVATKGRLKAGFVNGWWFGFGYFVFGLWWLAVALFKEPANLWALPFAVFGLPAGLALFYGLAGAVAACFWGRGPFRIVALAVAMIGAEWLRGHVASGFPWNAFGYTAMPFPLLMQADRVTGIYVMGGLALYVFAAPALLAGRYLRWPGIAFAGLLVVADVGYGWYRLADERPQTGHSLNVRLVQPALGEEAWHTAEGRENVFATMMAMSAEPPAEGEPAPDVIIWPESALPFLLEDRPDARTAIGEMLQPGQTLILGAARFAGRKPGGWPEFYNAIYVLNDAGETVSMAAKVHLVPFGEYLPFEGFFRSIGLEALTTLPGSYIAAENRQMLVLPDGTSFYPLVCYEASFPRLVADDAAGTSGLLNITYDAWFGRTPGPFQHFAQARMRAIETGRPLIRVGENGVTAVVDSRGRIKQRIPFGTQALLDGAVMLF